jgi:hypothetical protein
MSKIDRFGGNLEAFASDALSGERTLFGEATAADDLTSQVTDKFKRGWAIVGPNDAPTLQDFNALGYTSTQMLAYLHQMGVPEWHPAQEYQIHSFVNRNGVLYKCNTANLVSATNPESDSVNWATLVLVGVNGFSKADPSSVAFVKTGNGTAQVKAGTIVGFSDGSQVSFSSATSITMPALAAGTDYAIWVNKNATIQATTSHTTPPTTGARKIGGFHYAPGGNATAQSGGNTTPQINEYSFWDLKFRPNCPDPRGMTLVAGAFWSDIYRTGVDHHVNGSSRFNVAYARGTTPPKRPLAFGGNGSATYSSFNWWEASEVAKSHGKRLPTYGEYAALAYGTTENSSVGTDQNSTVLNAAYTSKWGVIQSSGVLWSWGDEFATGSIGAFDWFNEAGGRGNIYQAGSQSIRAARFGGNWGDGVDAGSRASVWFNHPVNSSFIIGAVLLGDHLQLD